MIRFNIQNNNNNRKKDRNIQSHIRDNYQNTPRYYIFLKAFS